jgi:hypothetical protein
MRVYKTITFAEGISMPLADFKKAFKPLIKDLSANEVKECHKVVTKGNGKLSNSSSERKTTDEK